MPLSCYVELRQNSIQMMQILYVIPLKTASYLLVMFYWNSYCIPMLVLFIALLLSNFYFSGCISAAVLGHWKAYDNYVILKLSSIIVYKAFINTLLQHIGCILDEPRKRNDSILYNIKTGHKCILMGNRAEASEQMFDG